MYPALWYLLTAADYGGSDTDPNPAQLPAYAHVDWVRNWSSNPYADPVRSGVRSQPASQLIGWSLLQPHGVCLPPACVLSALWAVSTWLQTNSRIHSLAKFCLHTIPLLASTTHVGVLERNIDLGFAAWSPAWVVLEIRARRNPDTGPRLRHSRRAYLLPHSHEFLISLR